MIITINGDLGSGKSTVAKILTEKLNLKHYSMGDLQREIAKEKGLTILELQKLEEKDDSIDRMIETKQETLGKTEDNFILDSRLGWNYIPDSIKIFLSVDIDEAARRIFEHNRDTEKSLTIEETKQKMIDRKTSELKRYKEYYNLDYTAPQNYDLIIDTTSIPAETVAEKIIEFVETFK